MKLALADGVPFDCCVSCTVLVLTTPEVAVLLDRVRFPFGDKVIDRLSTADDDVEADVAGLRSPGFTT